MIRALDNLLDLDSPELSAPYLVDLEIANGLRRMVRTEGLSNHMATGALDELRRLRMRRFPHHFYFDRIWELRHSLSARDAAYVALAEAIEAPLLTRDRALAIPTPPPKW